ncbi:MAG: hypothetical protein HY286_17120 [Planctomycetes bacterium]|nr:hypothetical protein [Planctomycetota bacterium]
MPKDDPDPEDPNELVWMAVPVSDAAKARQELARGLVEEYVRFGFDGNHIVGIFKNPFYAGAHAAFNALGEEFVRKAIFEACQIYRPMSTGATK